MRYLQTFLIILIVLFIYITVNYYIFIHGFHALPANMWLRISYGIVFGICSLAYLASRPLERTAAVKLHHVLYYTGALWFAALLYFFMCIVVIDMIRFLDVLVHFLPSTDSLRYVDLKMYAFTLITLIVVLILGYGFWNAANPRLKEVKLHIKKSAGKYHGLKIAMVSDIHLGSLINKRKVALMVDKINELHADIIVLAGDILDEIQEPIFRDDIGDPLKNLKSALGVYAITGNHEFIGGVNAATTYLTSKNIHVLRDSMVEVDHSFYIAGREDRDSKRFNGKARKQLGQIVQSRNESLPLILLDHQPFKLIEAVENGVDLQLSGHTHNGQFWPLNYIIRKIYEVSWGYKHMGNTHFYVSCGYGTWGPPIRLGNTPEIVFIRLSFQ